MRTKLAVACALTAFVAVSGGTAEATGLIHTSGIAKGAVTFNRLSPGVQKMVSAKATPGADGSAGTAGMPGTDGLNGAVGAQGLRGFNGIQGIQGLIGLNGAAGTNGAAGAAGTNGAPGLAGTNGASGLAGTNGAVGSNGLAGTNGAVGSNGLAGTNGAAGAAGTNGAPGSQGTAGANGAQGTKGDTGLKGDAGAPGVKGDNGAQGVKGDKGDNGAPGVASPLVFGPYNSGSTDSSACGGDWANDTYTRTYMVAPQADGSFQVTELFNGSFVTLAGTTPDNCAAGLSLPAGITGKFYGDYAVVVPSTADLNFTAVCPAGCTTGQFFTAFFGKPAGWLDSATYAWQFHYATANSTWDNTDHGNTGNITG